MPLHVTCPCGQLLVVPESRAGSTVRCPRCEASISVPFPAASESVAESPLPASQNTPSENASDELLPVIQPVSRQRWQDALQQQRAVNAVYWLAIALVLVALASAAPVLLVVVYPTSAQQTFQLEPWAYAIIFSAMLQCAYLVYLVQIPDWSTLRVISVLTLLHATLYAMLAGVQILALPGNRVLQWVGLADSRFSTGQQAGWCLIMVLLYGTLCYLAGHVAGRWKKRRPA